MIRCEECEFFRPFTKEEGSARRMFADGFCLRYPPTIYFDNTDHRKKMRSPEVSNTGGCGEGQLESPQEKPAEPAKPLEKGKNEPTEVPRGQKKS